jgi:hypothetical protein
MCKNTKKPKTTINEIIQRHEKEYIQKYNPDYNKLKILRAIRDCRTEYMGGRTETCDNCGHIITLYNSCRNRHCPLCQFTKKEQWISMKEKEVLPFQYFHVVFTLPHLLNPIIIRNQIKMYKLLFDTVKETLLSVCEEEKYFGAKIGFFSILHTWGQKLNLHYHLHCAVPGGGYSEKKKKWIACPKDYLVPIDVLRGRYKELYLKAFVKMYQNDELDLIGTGYEKRRDFYQFKDKLFKTTWVIYLKESFKNSNSVIKYLAKYTHRIAISNYRIIKEEDGKVYFNYRDYKDNNKQKVKEMEVLEFINNFMKHIVPYRFVRIRYYGIMSHRNKSKALAECCKFFDIQVKSGKNYLSWREYLFDEKGLDVTTCSNCGSGKMIRIKTVCGRKNRAPP